MNTLRSNLLFGLRTAICFDAENAGAAQAAAGAAPAGAGSSPEENAGAAPTGSAAPAETNPFAALDEDTRTWLDKRGTKDVADMAKSFREQESLVGASIRIPGKDATDEDRAAFLNKLGRPEEPTGYEFNVPKDLPADLPYDAERATAFKGMAHELGLTAEQAAKVHDWGVANAVADFNGSTDTAVERLTAKATQATEDLTKLWGPLDGEAAKQNFAYGNKALEVGGPELKAELGELGLLGPDGEIMSTHLATTLSKLGAAVYMEDGVLRGNPAAVDNPFEEGKNFNLTNAMALYKNDPDNALTLIAAAGKKPSDFGLKDK